ncbi:MAG: triphosphoribosyl-dephospho-CoA synthase, partial [Planctomycetia bacterium]|nr:triphosphoribosyl-dephospho-CoA synthase [Planctomycetia bacterium]
EAEEASHRARAVLEGGWPDTASGQERFASFDAWLRAAGNRRNPGATADLVTACLFIGLREGNIELPLRYPFALA